MYEQALDLQESGSPLHRRDAWMFRPLHTSECHLFPHRGNVILYQVSGGDFFQVDQVVIDILELADEKTVVEVLDLLQAKWPEKEIVSAYKELYESEVVRDLPVAQRRFHPPGRLEVVHLGLDITYDSLSGKSAFTGANANGAALEYMSEEVALKAIDLLFAESGRIRRCQVSFQGGDPLLNPNLLARIIDYGRERAEKLGKEIVFQVKSSSQLLNETALAELRRIGADIIVDVEDSDDELPLFSHATPGPFSLAPADLEKLADSGKDRLHVKRVEKDPSDAAEQLDHLLSRFPAARTITLSFSAFGAGSEALAVASMEAMAERVRNHVTTGGTAWIGDFEDAISQVFNQRMSMYHCGAGTRYLTVSPDGGLYVCPGLVRNEAFSVGNVEDGIDREAQRRWIKETHVEKFEGCSACWARYLCGGGCRLEAFQQSGDIRKPDGETCNLIRRTYELAMGTCLEIASADENRLYARYAEAS
jgi:uncharacterized protein